MQNTNYLFFVILAIIAGIIVTIQGPVNVELGKSFGNQYWATVGTFIVGGIFLIIYSLVTKQTLPNLSELGHPVNWWKLLGGILGAIYVLSVIICIPQLGVGTATVLLMFSQLGTAMIFDHFGLFGYEVRPFDIYRLIGVALMAVGIYLINKK